LTQRRLPLDSKSTGRVSRCSLFDACVIISQIQFSLEFLFSAGLNPFCPNSVLSEAFFSFSSDHMSRTFINSPHSRGRLQLTGERPCHPADGAAAVATAPLIVVTSNA
jgi:hypothetical protein